MQHIKTAQLIPHGRENNFVHQVVKDGVTGFQSLSLGHRHMANLQVQKTENKLPQDYKTEIPKLSYLEHIFFK